MKDKIVKIFNDYKVEFIKYFNITKKYIKEQFIKVKEYLLCAKNRRKNLTMIAASIVFNLFLLILSSNAYYVNNLNISVLQAVIGDFNSEKYDYSLKIHLENASEKGTYHLSNNIPMVGYTYNRYTCKNGSELVYENGITSVVLDQKDSCDIYFDIETNPDVIININVEEDINSNTYKIVENYPYFGYTYSSYNCNNNSELVIDDELHEIKTKTKQKDICNVYFKKIEEDININLFIEDGLETDSYYKNNFIPSNNKYSLNNSKSGCKDENNSSLDSEITYSDGVINISTDRVSYCDIYLDVENE